MVPRPASMALCGALASLPVASTVAEEPAAVARSLGEAPAVIAEPVVANTEPAPRVALVDVHGGEIVALDDASPSEARFRELARDRVTGKQMPLDPRLLDLLRRVASKSGTTRIELVSGFRSPKLNEQLRKKDHHVASHSQHSLGHAVDFRVDGLTPAQTKKLVLSLGWEGGIGQYDGVNDRFVHADVGRRRYWYGR